MPRALPLIEVDKNEGDPRRMGVLCGGEKHVFFVAVAKGTAAVPDSHSGASGVFFIYWCAWGICGQRLQKHFPVDVTCQSRMSLRPSLERVPRNIKLQYIVTLVGSKCAWGHTRDDERVEGICAQRASMMCVCVCQV